MMTYDEVKQKDRKAERQNDGTTERQKGRKTERKKDKKIETQKNRKTEREIVGMTKRQNDRKTENPCPCFHKSKCINVLSKVQGKRKISKDLIGPKSFLLIFCS